MFTLLQEGGDLHLQSFHFAQQRFVPGLRGFQLLLHILVVFQQGFIVHWDPLDMCGRKAVSLQINKSIFQFFYTACTVHAPQMPPSSLSRWCGCSWGSSLEEGFFEGAPHPETHPLHSGHSAVFAELTDSAAAQGLATVAQCTVLLMLNSVIYLICPPFYISDSAKHFEQSEKCIMT